MLHTRKANAIRHPFNSPPIPRPLAHAGSNPWLRRLQRLGSILGFVVRVGLLSEKRDHHPDVALGWGRARIRWTTHDAGGITQLDLDLAEATSKLAGV